MGANKVNVVVDLFCCGLRNFNVKVLQNVVLGNGGSVIAQKDLHDPQFPTTLLLSIHRCEFPYLAFKGVNFF